MIEICTEIFEDEIIRSQGMVLLEFTAQWCGVCRSVERLVDTVGHEIPDVKFCFADVDKNPELARKFSVRGVPTFIVFDEGELRSRKAGALTKRDLYEMLGRKPHGIRV